MNFKGNGGDYEKPEPRPCVGICFKIVDLGTQESSFNGKPNRKPKVLISWEIDQKMKDGKPFIVTSQYTRSLAETATLRKHLESWRGKAFTEQEIEEFNEKKILGKPALLNLMASEDGKYVNLKGVTAVPKGMPVPEPMYGQVVLSLDPAEFDQRVFDNLSDKLKAKIMLSPEWAALKDAPASAPDEAPPATEDGEEVPF